MRLLILATTLLLPFTVLSATYHGRLTAGGIVSQEKHEPLPQDLENRNDLAVFSTRFYLKVSEFWTSSHHFIADIRDKHDFFDKLSKEKQLLTAKNDFQLRLITLQHLPRRKGMVYKLGRFHEPKAGLTFVDGGSFGYRFNPKWEAAAFAGLNPKKLENAYLQFDSKSQTYGAYVDYVRGFRSFTKDFTLTNAFVVQQYAGEVDRQFLYNYFRYQFGTYNYLQTSFYYDFQPNLKLQNGMFSFHKLWFRRLITNLQYSVYDVIEYRRHQELRETLSPSPYQKVELSGKWKAKKGMLVNARLSAGQRDIDGLSDSSMQLKLGLPGYFSRFIDAYFSLEQRKRFTKSGSFVSVGVGYFRKDMEYNLDLEYGLEKQSDGSDLKPLIIEIAGTKRFSKSLFGSVSLQSATDEKVNIITTFFKFTYRFGNQGMAPIRDGAAPRGRL